MRKELRETVKTDITSGSEELSGGAILSPVDIRGDSSSVENIKRRALGKISYRLFLSEI